MEMKAYLTTAGNAVITSLLAAQGALTFTRAEIGTGVVSSEEAARARTSLIAKAADADLISCKLSNQQALIEMQYSNSGQTADYAIDEIAVYCKDPADATKEVLYCYATFGDTPDTIVKAATALYTRTYRITVYVSDLQSITVTVSPAGMVSQDDLDALEDSIDTKLAGKAALNHTHGSMGSDGTLTAAAAGADAGTNIQPVFAGTDAKLGVVTIAQAQQALKIPLISAAQASLPVAGWSEKAKTVSVAGVKAGSQVIVQPDPSCFIAWQDANVYCSAQSAGSLTFTCDDTPTAALTANVLIVEVAE